jgi:hypothetical protein
MRLGALTLFACLMAAPLAAQQPASSPAPAPHIPLSAPQYKGGGPRLQYDFPTYQPAVTRHETSVAAAADKTTITISTLGLVLIAVLLILLLT